jgi:beta-galactosidase/beta-glucuronidase
VEWEFFCTDGRNSNKWTTIKVPSCWEQQGFGGYTYGVNFYGKKTAPGITAEQGKYRYKFDVPAEWQGRRIRLVFDGVMTDAEVRINEQKAGEVHRGGFYRFAYDITSMVRTGGDNLLEVTVSKESANESVNLAERRADYWNFGGIFRPVFLEAFPSTFISRTAIDAKADGSFAAELYLDAAVEKGFSVAAQLTDAAGLPVGEPAVAEVQKGGDKATLTMTLENPKLWTAETPNLYKVKFTLKEGETVRHVTTERFGFRTLEVRKSDGIYLNGQRIMLRGVNRHSFYPETGRTLNRALNYADAKLIKEMNMNAVRMSHYPPDPDFLDACDELGLYVLNELGGWHGKYDEGVGRKLVGELVRRDVNHPSILFWDNGNEGGWNVALDDEFGKWDVQKRPVLHPQQFLNGIETMHYRSYGETQEYLRGDYIYMPTEFLHGLYDGGHGAGLYDYWEMMRKRPRCAGGFLWAYADEGVVRTDQNGRIDNDGNHGADGIVGPRHEKEGSFYAIRHVWSPIQVMNTDISENFNGTLSVENRYDFTNFNRCKVKWELAIFPKPEAGQAGHTAAYEGELAGSDIAPHASGALKLPLPGSWREADALYITVKNPQGEDLWTWSYAWKKNTAYFAAAPEKQSSANGKEKLPKVKNTPEKITVTAGELELAFDRATGELSNVRQGGKAVSLSGLRFTAARRGNRTLDGSTDAEAPKGMNLVYKEVQANSKLTNLTATIADGDALVEASYFGSLRRALWRISSDENIRLEYEYEYDGVVELMGVKFDYPESKVKSMRLLANGPYRVWQNRLHGATLNVWSNEYNDPVPGETFTYPEFKGYYSGWRWAVLETSEGSITLCNEASGSYLGVYAPRDGRDEMLYRLPQTGLAALDVIPAVRNKVNATDLIGPSSQAQRVSGVKKGVVHLKIKTSR